jgi:hypothetical protein
MNKKTILCCVLIVTGFFSVAFLSPSLWRITGGKVAPIGDKGVLIDAKGLEFAATDDHVDCSDFTNTNGAIFMDDNEGVLKKCEDGVLSDLDTGGSGYQAADDDLTVYAAGISGPMYGLGNGSGARALTNGDVIRIDDDSTTDGHTLSIGVYDTDSTAWKEITFENGDSTSASSADMPRMNIPDGIAVTGLIFQAPTISESELDDTTGTRTLASSGKETGMVYLTNYGETATLTYQMPAATLEGANFQIDCEAAYKIVLTPYSGASFIFNGTALDANHSIENDCGNDDGDATGALHEALYCYSTENFIKCRTSDTDGWIELAD